MKKTFLILPLTILAVSVLFIQSASAIEHVKIQTKTLKNTTKTQTQQVQAAAAAKIDYADEEYAKRFYTKSNLKNNYYKKP